MEKTLKEKRDINLVMIDQEKNLLLNKKMGEHIEEIFARDIFSTYDRTKSTPLEISLDDISELLKGYPKRVGGIEEFERQGILIWVKDAKQDDDKVTLILTAEIKNNQFMSMLMSVADFYGNIVFTSKNYNKDTKQFINCGLSTEQMIYIKRNIEKMAGKGTGENIFENEKAKEFANTYVLKTKIPDDLKEEIDNIFNL
jgi:hypothetical protein